MTGRSASPRLYLERCDDDIDILSEMLSKHSDASTDEGLNVSEQMLEDDMDELTSYLCGSSNGLKANVSQCSTEHDPFMSPSARDSSCIPESGDKVISSSSLSPRSAATSVGDPQGKNTIKNPPETKDEKLGHSKSIVLYVSKDQTCLNKNALAARENRKKKKQYIQQLEVDVNVLKTENASLNTKLSDQEETINYLKEQVKYLQNVIANQSTLSALLKNIGNTSGVHFKSSWATRRKLSEVSHGNSEDQSMETSDENQENLKSSIRRSKRKCEFDSENTDNCKRVNVEKTVRQKTSDGLCRDSQESIKEETGGVCLHVSGAEVSLEFCANCSKMAATGRALNDHTRKSGTKSRHEISKVPH